MTPQEFQKFYPLIAQWLRETLAAHARSARAVASCGFLGLPLYFKAETLSSAKVVVLDRLGRLKCFSAAASARFRARPRLGSPCP